MMTNGSIDSMEKSTFNSSIDDTQSYDIFEAHNPNPNYSYSTHEYTNPIPKQPSYPTKPQNQYSTPGSFGLSYKNEGYRDNSTFTSRNNSAFQSRAESIHDTTITNEETPIIHSSLEAQDDPYTPSEYYNTDTLPMNSTFNKSDSTLDLKREVDENNTKYENGYGYQPQTQPHSMNFLIELKSRMPNTQKEELNQTSYMDLPSPPDPPKGEYNQNGLPQPSHYMYTPDYNTVALSSEGPYTETPTYPERPQSANILETNLDNVTPTRPMPKSRSKSEALLETNFDYVEAEDNNEVFTSPLTTASRSKSQPLETAM